MEGISSRKGGQTVSRNLICEYSGDTGGDSSHGNTRHTCNFGSISGLQLQWTWEHVLDLAVSLLVLSPFETCRSASSLFVGTHDYAQIILRQIIDKAWFPSTPFGFWILLIPCIVQFQIQPCLIYGCHTYDLQQELCYYVSPWRKFHFTS